MTAAMMIMIMMMMKHIQLQSCVRYYSIIVSMSVLAADDDAQIRVVLQCAGTAEGWGARGRGIVTR